MFDDPRHRLIRDFESILRDNGFDEKFIVEASNNYNFLLNKDVDIDSLRNVIDKLELISKGVEIAKKVAYPFGEVLTESGRVESRPKKGYADVKIQEVA